MVGGSNPPGRIALVAAASPVGRLTYTGRITVWGNFNENERNANTTFTTSVKLPATDGQGVVHTEVGHEVGHMLWSTADPTLPPVMSFGKMYFTCT